MTKIKSKKELFPDFKDIRTQLWIIPIIGGLISATIPVNGIGCNRIGFLVGFITFFPGFGLFGLITMCIFKWLTGEDW